MDIMVTIRLFDSKFCAHSLLLPYSLIQQILIKHHCVSSPLLSTMHKIPAQKDLGVLKGKTDKEPENKAKHEEEEHGSVHWDSNHNTTE